MASTSTGIEWTERTWGPVVGCDKVSAGCKKCYALAMGKRLRAMAEADIAAGRNPGRKRYYLDVVDDRGRWKGATEVPEALGDPLKWRKPGRVFVNSMGDLFHPAISNEYIAAVFGVMAKCPHLQFQVLTKYISRACDWFRWVQTEWDAARAAPSYAPQSTQSDIVLGAAIAHGARIKVRLTTPPWPLHNVWLVTSVEDQPSADARIPRLLECPAAVRGVSYEPGLGPVDFTRIEDDGDVYNALTGATQLRGIGATVGPRLNWVVVGGESGPGARPFDVEWARSTIAACRDAGVACFVKQLGARPFWCVDYPRLGPIDSALRDKKGGDPSEWPTDLRVRQYPETDR